MSKQQPQVHLWFCCEYLFLFALANKTLIREIITRVGGRARVIRRNETKIKFDWHKHKELNLIDMWLCTHSLRSFVWCDVNDCIQRTEFVIHINQFSHLTSDLYSRMLFLDTETHLLWIQTAFMCVFMYSWFEFNLAVFLCQIKTNQIWYIKFHSYVNQN